ncbi:MAG: hypothetical protein K1X28_05820 [Parachlamydiales bacterium]|nr:hypothetical protein [Parachlamydiales bacterium]
MGALVSSRFDFIENNPKAQLSYAEVDHELNHLKKREHVSSLVALGSLVLGLLTISGVLGGGAFLLGALFAIAGVAAAYAYCCRMAESGLRDRQMIWFVGHTPTPGNILPPAQKPVDESGE